MKNLSNLLAVLAIFLCASISYGQTNYVKRVNCGDTNSTSHNGETYDADDGNGYTFTGDNKSTSGHSNFTLKTNPGEIFANTRYTKLTSMSYDFPVQDGDYEIILHWAEPYHGTGLSGNADDYRQFDVSINSTQVEDNLCVYCTAGLNQSMSRTYSVTASGGNGVTIEFGEGIVSGSRKNDPIIQAIEVLGVDNSDNQAPNIPTGLTVDSFDHESANISWNATSDNGGGNVAGYYIYDNGTQMASSTGTSTTLTGLSEQTLYQLSIAAFDDATPPNVSGQSSPTVDFTTGSSGGGNGSYDPDFVLRINTGGPAGTFDTKSFLADQYFSGGAVYSNTNTGLAEPYVSERYDTSSTLSYDIPVANGDYRIILHFAELYYGATGGGTAGTDDRVFDVSIEGQLKIDNYNIYAQEGAQTPVTKTFDVTATGDELNIYLSSLSADGGAGHPKISAIEVLGTNQYSTNPPSGGDSWTHNGTTNDIHYDLGNVGIGTSNPGTYKLAVNGHVRAKEVKVETNWADYVFTKDYNLPTLEEVKKHIAEKGHLINIPSAAEVEANGIELGEMNKLLLEKIEELTLYILEQESRIQELESNIQKK